MGWVWEVPHDAQYPNINALWRREAAAESEAESLFRAQGVSSPYPGKKNTD